MYMFLNIMLVYIHPIYIYLHFVWLSFLFAWKLVKYGNPDEFPESLSFVKLLCIQVSITGRGIEEKLSAKRDKNHVLFGGTKILQHTPDKVVHNRNFCVFMNLECCDNGRMFHSSF